MNIGELCTRAVVTVRASDDIVKAAQLMREKNVGYMVVVEPRGATDVVPIGVLTDRDIVIAIVAREVDVRALRVDDVMTREPLTLSDNESLESALMDMRRRGVRRAPVVGDQGQLIGVASIDDLLSALAGTMRHVTWSIGQVEHALRHQAE